MKSYKVTIEGITPLLMNRFHEAAEQSVSSGTAAVFRGTDNRREDAEKRAYRFKNGNLYVPGVNLFASIMEAGKFHKSGRSKLTTQKTSLVPAALAILEVELPLGTKKFEVDSRPVTIPATGGKVMRHRPRLDEWKLSFTLSVDTDMFSPKLARALVDDAGKKIGLGDFRPQRKGPFGRFVVTQWKEEKPKRK